MKRPPHASMMDATVARPGDWQRAQLRLLQAMLPDADRPRRAPLPLLPLARAARLQSLVAHLVARQATMLSQGATVLPALLLDPRVAQEGLAMASAVAQQCWTLQSQWVEGLAELAEEMGETRQVNTVTKYAGQEMNLMHQALALLTAQTTATLQLMENVQVDTAWWLSQRAHGGD